MRVGSVLSRNIQEILMIYPKVSATHTIPLFLKIIWHTIIKSDF
jgi:hypothetical protein